jgi:hypothetical protein
VVHGNLARSGNAGADRCENNRRGLRGYVTKRGSPRTRVASALHANRKRFINPTCTHRITRGRAEDINRAQRHGRKILGENLAAGGVLVLAGLQLVKRSVDLGQGYP